MPTGHSRLRLATANRVFGVLLALSALCSCHEAPRSNPMDPTLTPAVTLTAALDDTAGTVTLTWSQYSGDQAFARYLVIRNKTERIRPDTLARIYSIAQTTYVDSTLQPSTGYDYRVEVVNSAGLPVSSPVRSVRGYDVALVRLLAAESDSLTGAIRLRWTRFVGPGLAGYTVVRRQMGTDLDTVVCQLQGVADTAAIDTTARHGVGYLYQVRTAASGQLLQSQQVEGRLSLPAVTIVGSVPASATASAAVVWTAYRGPRFAGYRVERRAASLDWQQVFVSQSRTDTACVDRGLLGDTEYQYRAIVTTDRNEELASPLRTVWLHRLVGAWHLDLRSPQALRLARAEGGDIAILATVPRIEPDFQAVYLLDRNGAGMTLLHPVATFDGAPQGSDLVCAGGMEYVSVANGLTAGVLQYRSSGEAVETTRQLFARSGLLPLRADQTAIAGEVRFSGSAGNGCDVVAAELYSGQVLRRADSFVAGIPAGWEFRGQYYAGYGANVWPNTPLSHVDATWRDPSLRARVLSYWPGSGPSFDALTIELGGSTQSKLALTLDWGRQQVKLIWTYNPPSGTTLAAQQDSLVESASLLPNLRYTVGLQVVGGQVQATLGGPALVALPNRSGRSWTSMAHLGKELVLTVFDSAYVVTPGGGIARAGRLPGGVSEIRTWSTRRGTGVGVCLPEKRMLVFGDVQSEGEARWTEPLTQELGPPIGNGQGFLSYPVSFDVGPDGRIFVLDAGLRRVLVFGRDRRYLTQWGREGNGDGEFMLGAGGRTDDLSMALTGSIAVDDSGYVYVADPGNQRIQKFAP